MEKKKQVIMFVGTPADIKNSYDEKLAEMGYEIVYAEFNRAFEEICAESKLLNADVLVIDESSFKGVEAFDLLKFATVNCRCGIIYLSKNNDVMKEILALEIGADDYLRVPFHPGLLAVRIRNLLKRKTVKEYKNDEEVRYPGLVVNLTQYRAEIDGEVIKMPPKELELLYLLASNPNTVYTREKLLDMVWGYDFDVGSRTVDVHIKRLRDKIEKDSNVWQIATVWSVGYRFEFKDDFKENDAEI